MDDRELKLELVKLNIVVFGAVVSAISLGVSYFEPHIALGTALLGITAFLQYMSLMPEFSMLSSSDSESIIKKRDKKLNEWYIILGSGAYIFLIFGFAYPHILSDSNLFGLEVGAVLPFLGILGMYVIRLNLLKEHPTRDATKFDSLVFGLLLLLIGLLTLGVLEA
ncbi:hypothetical protein C482_08853 [Natrialba chahannaoensis JCM 10990]|uniref:Uncharacterized protein n=1 Tax=Natrialba chahannaoensis JCM 10990 TaxID=1227492 RepID=M0AQS7_9EURY|nr:hypothetical protein [Natrialba chahannaoensis]ELZ00298.1 hypothetical protein C482_08853 [Natrialba chahannaoensis JCM 10990]